MGNIFSHETMTDLPPDLEFPEDVLYEEILPSAGFDALYDQRRIFPLQYRERLHRPDENFLKFLTAVEHDDLNLFVAAWQVPTVRESMRQVKSFAVDVVLNSITRGMTGFNDGVFPGKIFVWLLQNVKGERFRENLVLNSSLFDQIVRNESLLPFYLACIVDSQTNESIETFASGLLSNMLLDIRIIGLGDDGKTPIRRNDPPLNLSPNEFLSFYIVTNKLLMFDKAAEAFPLKYGKLRLSPQHRVPIKNFRELCYQGIRRNFENDEILYRIVSVRSFSEPMIVTNEVPPTEEEEDDAFYLQRRRRWSVRYARRWYQIVSSPLYYGWLALTFLEGEKLGLEEEFLSLEDGNIFQPERFLDELLMHIEPRCRRFKETLLFLRGMLRLPFTDESMAYTNPGQVLGGQRDAFMMTQWKLYEVNPQTRQALAYRLVQWMSGDLGHSLNPTVKDYFLPDSEELMFIAEDF